MDAEQQRAVEMYARKMHRAFVPGDVVEMPVDALVFAEYQDVWTTLDEYKERRCIYDEETNDELVHFVTDFLLGPEIPPIYVDISLTGPVLVDGAHRVSAALIAGRPTILAQLNEVNQWS